MLPFPFQDGDIQKKVHITAQKFFEMSRLFFRHRPIDSLNVLPHQVPIATKSACEKNMKENGHSFDPNTVCAGGNGKGTCKVFKGTLLFNIIFFLQESNLHGALLGWAESLSGNGACVCVCMCAITSKKINNTFQRLHRPL